MKKIHVPMRLPLGEKSTPLITALNLSFSCMQHALEEIISSVRSDLEIVTTEISTGKWSRETERNRAAAAVTGLGRTGDLVGSSGGEGRR